jgi:hypothetical protein
MGTALLDREARRVARRTVGMALVVALGALLFVRCNSAIIELAAAEQIRLREALDALPAVAKRAQPSAVIFGSSLIWMGVSVQDFDAELRANGVELTTYNFGFGGMNPESQRLLARRIRSEYEREGQRLALAVVEFNPFQATEARARNDQRTREQRQLMLLTLPEILDVVMSDPERGASLLATRYLRSSISADTIRAILGFAIQAIGGALDDDEMASALQGTAEPEASDENEEAQLQIGLGLFEAHGGIPPLWEIEQRGDANMLFPETRDAYASLASPSEAQLRADLDRRISCCDILELNFDAQLIRDFIALVDELAQVSDRVEILLMPIHPVLVRREPETQARYRALIARIQHDTGAGVVDFQLPHEIEARLFIDSTHLNLTHGRPWISRLLARHYASSLRR